MDIFNYSKNSIQFSGDLKEALILEQMPTTDANIFWKRPLAQILRVAEAIPKPWEASQVLLTHTGLSLPDNLKVIFAKDGILNLIIDDMGIHIRHIECGLAGAPCPPPKQLSDIDATLRQVHLNFLAEITSLMNSINNCL